MIQNTDPYGPNDTPNIVNGAMNMSQINTPMNFAQNLSNMNKVPQRTPETPSPQCQLPNYASFNHANLNMSPQIGTYPSYLPSTHPVPYMAHNTTSFHDTSWQNGLFPMNLNAQSSYEHNMMSYSLPFERKQAESPYPGGPYSEQFQGKALPISIPQVPPKALNKFQDFEMYNANRELFNHYNSTIESRSNVEVTQEKVPERPLINNTKRKSLENTVRLIEDLLINTTKNRELQSRELQNRELESKDLQSRESQSRDLQSRYLHTRDLQSRDLQNRDMQSRDLQNRDLQRDLQNRELQSRDMQSRDLQNRDLQRDLQNRELQSRALLSKDLESRDLQNKALQNKELQTRELQNRELQTRELLQTRDLQSREIQSRDLQSRELQNKGIQSRSLQRDSGSPKSFPDYSNNHNKIPPFTNDSIPTKSNVDKTNPYAHESIIKKFTESPVYTNDSILRKYVENTEKLPVFDENMTKKYQEKPDHSDDGNSRKFVDTDEKPKSSELIPKSIAEELEKQKTSKTNERNLNLTHKSTPKPIWNTILDNKDENTKKEINTSKIQVNQNIQNSTKNTELERILTKNLELERMLTKELTITKISKNDTKTNQTEPQVKTSKKRKNTSSKKEGKGRKSKKTKVELIDESKEESFVEENNDPLELTNKTESVVDLSNRDQETGSPVDVKPILDTVFVKIDVEDEPVIDVKVESLYWTDTDYLDPFHRDTNGTIREDIDNANIIQSETSVDEAMASLKHDMCYTQPNTYYECPHCTLLFNHPKRFLVHAKWHSFGLINQKRSEMAREKEIFKNQKKEARVVERMISDEVTEVTKPEGQNVYACKDCDKAFCSKASLKNHRQRYHPSRLRECKICGETAIGWVALRLHAATHHKTGIVCPDCGKYFKHAHSLTKHRDTHKEKTVPCDQCPKKFGSIAQLKMHSKVHERAARGATFQCSYCAKSFYEAYNLTVHERTHRNERPYVCTICNANYGTNSGLQRHIKVSHNAAKPFQCHICQRNFSAQRIRDRHILRVHESPEVFTFACTLCERRYMKPKDLRKHMNKMHPKNKRKRKEETETTETLEPEVLWTEVEDDK